MNADGHAKQKLAYDIVSAKEHSEDAIDFIVKVPNEKIEKKLMRLNTETLNETFVSYLGVEKGNNKSKSLAILLGFLFGWLGIHNFYIGYGYRGIAQLVVTLFGFIFASPIFILMSLMSAWIEIGQIKKGNPNSTPAGIEIE
jgi:TM2 domain-containing membrane protein YozV